MDISTTINEIKKEYQELNKKLSSPEIINNKAKLKRFSSRISELTPIKETVQAYEKNDIEIKETENILKDDSSTKEFIELATSELKSLKKQQKKIIKKLENQLQKQDPNDSRDAIIEIRAGTGGEEAALFAAEIYRMYLRYAEKNNWKFSQLSTNRTGNGGYKEIIGHISGKNVYGKLKFENGVHRVQRVPTTESSGRIHTSAVSVVILPEVDDIDIEIKNEDIEIDVYRSSGPGGQSVNTTDSAVRITHIPTQIVVTCQDEKSQHKNKARAFTILKSKLYEKEQEKIESKQKDRRRNAIKSGDRSAKIRTYNFPQNRVTDHRIKKSWYNLDSILDGEIEEIIQITQKELDKNIINLE